MKRFKKILIISLVVVAILGTFWILYQQSKPKVQTFSIVTPSVQTISKNTLATGEIDPRDEINIVPQISGIISNLYKEAGDSVQEGEIIATIKVIPDLATLNNAESQLETAKINLKKIESEFNRVQKLYDSKVATRQEFEQAENQYLIAKQNLADAQDYVDIVKKGVADKYASSSNTNVRATVSGMVLDVPIKVGNSVIQANTMNPGTTIATIADMTDMIFVGKIDETEVNSLTIGMDLLITVGAIQGRKFNAKLEYVSPKSINVNGAIMFEIKAAVEVPSDAFIRAGYSANAEIILDERENVLTVPESVVEFEDDKTYVEVFIGMDGEKQLFEKKEIEIGLSNGMYVEVLSGLNGDEQLKGETESGKS